MTDYEMMSPAEKETAIRHDYEAARHSIDALIHRLMEEYRYYD